MSEGNPISAGTTTLPNYPVTMNGKHTAFVNPEPSSSDPDRAHSSAAVGYLLLGGLMGRAARCAEAMRACSRLLWAPRQYTWPQLWQRENTW